MGNDGPATIGFIATRLLLAAIALAVILAAWVVRARLHQATGMRAGRRDVIDQKRHANKGKSNRIVMSIGRAGRRLSPFALVRHTGRKSGKPYVTPVRLMHQGDRFTIPLTYGERSDWYQNLQATGRMEILWQGVTYQVGHPERLEVSEALDEFPGVSRFLFWLDGLPAFVRVTVIDSQAFLPGILRRSGTKQGNPFAQCRLTK